MSISQRLAALRTAAGDRRQIRRKRAAAWRTLATMLDRSERSRRIAPEGCERRFDWGIDTFGTPGRLLAREELHDSLAQQGYRRLLRLGPRTWYLNRALFEPHVMVHAEGFVRVRGHRALPLPLLYVPTEADAEIFRLAWPPPEIIVEERILSGDLVPSDPTASPQELIEAERATVVRRQAHFAFQSRRASRARVDRVVRSLEPSLSRIRDATWSLSRGTRAVELRVQLLGIWLDGVDADGTPLPHYQARRAALVDRWLQTADSEPGAWARAEIVAFVDEQVQTSEHPFRPDEIAAANARRSFGDVLEPLAAR